MRYLLDVNALIAFGHTEHQFHERVYAWAQMLSNDKTPQFATTPITELGFVRIVAQVYGVTIAQSKSLLQQLKEFEELDFIFIADDQDAGKLPSWVERAKHTTDGHLSELAKANNCVLATLDSKIPGSFLIP
jgi:predicted nucleic acid-binding protein